MKSSSSAVPAAAEESFAPFPYLDAVSPAGAAAPSAPGLEDQVLVREKAAHQAGLQEGETRGRELCAQQTERMRETVRAALADFQHDRQKYFQQVEGEVVELAVNMARSILHREVQIDPLLLAGMAHVALSRIEGGTQVVLKVHPQRAESWRSYFESRMAPGEVPEILEDAAVDLERCVIQTSLGTTELGISLQLKAIEQGLLDLIAKRPERQP